MKRNKGKNYTTLTNLILYSLLLMATPFLIIQNYLQQMIGVAAQLSFSFIGIKIPYILLLFAVILTGLLIAFRKKIKLKHFYLFLVFIGLLIVGQNSTDYYFNHHFFELQHNWHYLAYGVYSFLIYLHLKQKDYPLAKIISITFIIALGTSAIDEAAQILISNRVFDVCDVGKDVWGAVIGIVIIFFGLESKEIFKEGWKFRQSKISDYLKKTLSLLFLQIILAYLFLLISSILSESRYIGITLVITLSSFIIFFLIFHLSQKKKLRYFFISLLAVLIIGQSISYIIFREDNIIYNKKGLVIYKGIPIPYFDVMIFPNSTFRLVDKKLYFNQKDKMNRIYHHCDNILLIGSGEKGEGGMGFILEERETEFIYNPISKIPLQVEVLKTPEACREYNILKKLGYNVMFIIHN